MRGFRFGIRMEVKERKYRQTSRHWLSSWKMSLHLVCKLLFQWSGARRRRGHVRRFLRSVEGGSLVFRCEGFPSWQSLEKAHSSAGIMYRRGRTEAGEIIGERQATICSQVYRSAGLVSVQPQIASRPLLAQRALSEQGRCTCPVSLPVFEFC